MEQKKPNLIMRNDTVLGVCEAIGDEFGFHANWLRIGFGLLLFVSAAGTLALYLILGIGVALSRWLFPRVDAAASTAPAATQRQADAGEEEQLQIAA